MLTAADDGFHPVADPDPLWTETTWWGFMVPERSLGGMLYTLFRPNLGVASVVVQVWDADAVEPWRAPYARQLWHLPHPTGDLTDLRGRRAAAGVPRAVDGLPPAGSTTTTSSRSTWSSVPCPRRTRFRLGGGSGHFDQAGRVHGRARRRGRGRRRRRAGPARPVVVRPPGPPQPPRRVHLRRRRRGRAPGGPQLGASRAPTGDETLVLGGYLVRDGSKADLVSGTRRVERRRRGHPDVVGHRGDRRRRPAASSPRGPRSRRWPASPPRACSPG